MSNVGKIFPPAWLPDGVLAIAEWRLAPGDEDDDGESDEYILKVGGRYKRVWHNDLNDYELWLDWEAGDWEGRDITVVAEGLTVDEDPYRLNGMCEAFMVMRDAAVPVSDGRAAANEAP